MTALVDVTFLVLMFTMCTTEFRSLESALRAELPRDVWTLRAPLGPTALDVVVQVASRGDGRALRYRVGAHVTERLDDVASLLRHHHGIEPRRRVRIDPREGTTQQDVVSVLDLVRAAGFDVVTFAAPRER